MVHRVAAVVSCQVMAIEVSVCQRVSREWMVGKKVMWNTNPELLLSLSVVRAI